MALRKTALNNVVTTDKFVPFHVLQRIHQIQGQIATELGTQNFTLKVSSEPIKLANGKRNMWQLDIVSKNHCFLSKEGVQPSKTAKRFTKFNGGRLGISLNTAVSRNSLGLPLLTKV